ncbi:amidohydrolase 2 [Trametes versicolor FP-101664 SS1]|uniref:amidohydrolase 2 n=1 Tax=Trametes versicolor (strain FP-101664) TaxID=717944 RepID=UPI0004623BA3|nr:amidohydrolase 2 [Trametes versicolor FP-101664 SS1]EIW61491.1 amidohydrolase 2 [Trametes versicolor FP-101664 SS1]
MAAAHRLLVDIHTHVYLPRYAAFLRSRTSVPRIFTRTSAEGKPEDRLLILDDEPSEGRPIGSQYWDRDEKLKFMDRHAIDVSVVSSANPWLDFLPAPDAHKLAEELNTDMEDYCSAGPSLAALPSAKRLYGFGLLPLVPGASADSLVSTVAQISKLPHLKGVIMGTRGLGKGLDDDALEPVWGALEKAGLVVFLHPHYGVDKDAWGARDNGHVLPLALGFPFETTVATTRLILSGVLDRYPALRLLLAHSGGALPALSSRLSSCIEHDPVVASRLTHDARYYLGRLYFDAVAYGAEELGFVSDTIGRADKYVTAGTSAAASGANAVDSVGQRRLGSGRMLFGTDHPFFPPLGETEKWKSVVENLEAIDGVWGWTEKEKDAVRGGNAFSLFSLGS